MAKTRRYDRERIFRDAYEDDYDELDDDLDFDLDDDDEDLDTYDDYEDEEEMTLTPFEKAEAAYMENSAEELSSALDSLSVHIKNVDEVHLSMGRQGGSRSWSGMSTLNRVAEDLKECRDIINVVAKGGEMNKQGLNKLQNTLDTTAKTRLSQALNQVRSGRKNRNVDPKFKQTLGRLSSSISKVQNAYKDFRNSHGIERKAVKRPGAGRRKRSGWDDTKLSG